MSQMIQIKPADREFFETIAQTAFCNPFSEKRSELDAKIVGHDVAPMAETHISEMTGIVSARIRKLEEAGLADIRDYSTRDREIMQTVFLFDLFHQFYKKFDDFIIEQVQAGPQSLEVPFASDLLARLQRRGISKAESVRYFGIFYQLRRAFHFIVRGLKGTSPCMREFRSRLWQSVFTRDVSLYDRYLWSRMEDFSTLLLGETGTGKGAAASAIGRSGFIPFDEKQGRFAESFMRGFISLNLSQFPETLIESELFGHRRGAFTGAVEPHQGVLARCSPHGAIFLDEIGDVSVPVQIKLLQVLQERTFCPVGSHETERFRGRVIAATNRNLQTLRERNLFRDDFFYRLCSDVIHVPPLRQRLQEDPGELRIMLQHMLTGILGVHTADLEKQIESIIHRDVGDEYAWPGNVRELEQAVRCILLTGRYSVSSKPITLGKHEEFIANIESRKLDAEGLLQAYCSLLYEELGTYEEVARRTDLDRRTVKRYLRGFGGQNQ